MHKFLIIQTSFIGDVVLATAVAEKLHATYPEARIDFLLRKGNESLLRGHPFITQVLVWNKQDNKKRNLMKMMFRVRKEKYSHVINLHRFGSTGFITFLSGAKHKIGFDKSPFSSWFTKKIAHTISEPYTPPVHEIERNQLLIADLTDHSPAFPKLYPNDEDYMRIRGLQATPYICIAPSSVWFTKQFPTQKWIELIDYLPSDHKVYLLGALTDEEMAKAIIRNTRHRNVTSLCGSISFLQSAALMQGAAMNYTNDSAPLHFATAVNAPVTAVFCSTVPAFGFGPVHKNGRIVEIEERLYCRPCGLHGHKACPEGHFRCALDIKKEQLLWWTLNKTSETV
ncbi:MAG TPA: glycosyltransferase family 9 protein [Flavipsychrobacter sp.]|nr:glycosyltransferase family 9 protein [Flavipsychrobacter sp.]